MIISTLHVSSRLTVRIYQWQLTQLSSKCDNRQSKSSTSSYKYIETHRKDE